MILDKFKFRNWQKNEPIKLLEDLFSRTTTTFDC